MTILVRLCQPIFLPPPTSSASICSKVTMLLVKEMLKFQTYYMYMYMKKHYQFLPKNVKSFCTSKVPISFLAQNITLKCLSIGTPKIINFPFVSNGKLIVFRCPNIQAHCNEAVLCLNFGTPENNEFSIWDKWKIYYL